MKKQLGKRIKELRQQRQLTQAQLSEMIDISERNFSKLECGLTFLTADTLEKLAKALGVTAKELFDFEHLKEQSTRKTELITAIKNDNIDLDLLYKIYLAIKK